jgi:hypothetical protein
MAVKNFYPALPVIPYKRTSCKMEDVVRYANSLTSYTTEVKRMAYCMFRNESANGDKGVNGNYAGIQADCGLWSGLKGAVATSVRIDSGNKERRFICFDEKTGVQDTFNFLCFKVRQRGMFIGAVDVPNINALVSAYLEKWVGRTLKVPSQAELRNWTSLYNSAAKLIP